MTISPLEWEFAFVLPNFALQPSDDPLGRGQRPNGIDLGTDTLAIVSGHDARVTALCERQPGVRRIITAFHDEMAKPYRPSVLITRIGAPRRATHDLQSIISFRNAVALCIVLRGRAAAARGYSGSTPSWSDTFDLHPIRLADNGSIIAQTLAYHEIGLSYTTKLHYTPSAYVPVTSARSLHWDPYLYRSLGAEWRQRYLDPGADDDFSHALFRSLEVAYAASAVFSKNEGSLHDFGIQLGLWVSAMEILAWPKNKNGDVGAVVDLLQSARVPYDLESSRFTATVQKKKRTDLNIYQHAYAAMNSARNAFLHGNPVTTATLVTNTGTRTVALPRLAALVYRAALTAYLDPKYWPETDDPTDFSEEAASDWPFHNVWEKLFLGGDDDAS
jgi:hypothetical protein